METKQERSARYLEEARHHVRHNQHPAAFEAARDAVEADSSNLEALELASTLNNGQRARVRQDARAAAVVMPFAKVAARVVLNGSTITTETTRPVISGSTANAS